MPARHKRGQEGAGILDDSMQGKRRLVRPGDYGPSEPVGFLNPPQTPQPPEDVAMNEEIGTPYSSESICYGALCDAKAKITFSKGLIAQLPPWNRFHAFQLAAHGEYYQLIHTSGMKTKDIGMLDLVTTKYLHSIENTSGLSFTAVLASSGLDSILRRPVEPKIVDISVNIIGPERMADNIGNILADTGAYLQHPFVLQTGVKYMNPQYFYSRSEETDLSHLIGPLRTDSRSALFSRRMENLLDSLDDPLRLAASNTGETISEAVGEGIILTPLKSYQRDGIRFILNREDQFFCASITSELKALINSRSFPNSHLYCLGGIIADVMGLGKTLTMLSAIVCSKNAAREFSRTISCPTTATSTRTRATLVVVTSIQVLEVWTSEIQKHFMPGTLKVAIFHGNNRAKTTHALQDYDVVLTTYRTLATDWKGRRVLQELGWFRVVLDEAHWIRNQSSEQFKAAEVLQTDRRWCLTGTPIQNSLDDLRSLLSFLHFQPFSNKHFFEKHIIEPLRSDSDSSFRNMRILLQVICLRRNAACLQLPPAETEVVTVNLTHDERAAYDKVLAECQADFDRIVSTKSDLKRYTVLFTTIMKLRQICNHGTLPATVRSDLMLCVNGNRSKNQRKPRSGELFCESCGGEDEDTAILLQGLETCPECCRFLGNKGASLSQALKSEISPFSPSSSLEPSVTESGSTTPQPLSPMSLDPSFKDQAQHSSKLVAVANNIEKSPEGTKSLVFSSWRLTLYLLANILTDRGITPLRIDGRVSFAERLVILQKFNEEPNTPVLLMSIGTGAVGLTLTVANHVHIVEPQWNPSVEEQAIARALRMGQTRTVTVFKYITEKTVEQNILTLQKNKSQIAKYSLDSSAENNPTGTLDDLKFVLDTGID